MGMMLNRRRMMMGKGLPYDAEVEYLMNNNGSYIDTGIKASGNLSVRMMLYNYFRSEFLGKWCFGARNSSTSRKYGIYINSNTSMVNFSYGAGTDAAVVLGNYSDYPSPCEIEISNGYVIIGGTRYSYNTASFMSSYNILLYGLNNGGTPALADGLKIGATYLTNGTDSRDFIPVRVGQVGYMYDKVSGELFGNAGTGSFIVGPDRVNP